MPTTAKPTPSWRDVRPIHPAADLFPLMSPDELTARSYFSFQRAIVAHRPEIINIIMREGA